MTRSRSRSFALFAGPLVLAAIPPLVVAALVAWVWLERRPFCDENAPRELHAIMALRVVWQSEQEFFRRNGRYGSLDELTQRAPERGAKTFLAPTFAPVTRDSALRRDYYIRVQVLENGATSPLGEWFVYAWPVSEPFCYRTFVMWSDGTIFATSGYAGSLYPPPFCAVPAGTRDERSLWYAATDGSEWRMTG